MKRNKCKKCGRLLFKGEAKTIEIKCPKCGYIQNIQGDKQRDSQKRVDFLKRIV
ncbi:MAG: Com family DNA-binding transcriptional regulator [Desulfobacterales bacterium]|nr:Com family DNA-binding transcriptional regulator [Desulfobacterales bacterium]